MTYEYWRESAAETPWIFTVIQKHCCKIWVFHSGEYEDLFLLGCCAVQYRPDDGGSMTSETVVNIDQTTQRNNSEDSNLQKHCCMCYKFSF
jgi:hypothetical protein